MSTRSGERLRVYRRPADIAGFQPRGTDTLVRLVARELSAAVVVGALAGAALLSLGSPSGVLVETILLATGLAAGGRAAEYVFFHRVGPRMPDPFSPGSYIARAGLWALGGGFGALLAHLVAVLFTAAGFAGAIWFFGGAALNVLVQAPIRVWIRRRDERLLAGIRR